MVALATNLSGLSLEPQRAGAVTHNIAHERKLMASTRMNQTLFGKLALGAIAPTSLLLPATLVLGLASCGGSSSSSTPATSSTLLAGPATFVAFGNTANTIGITGGKGPFTVVSSNPTLVPVTAAIRGASFTFTPANVAAATPVTLTVTDSAGATSVVTATITPATIPAALITITPAVGSVCAAANNAATTAATLCQGETGTASVTLKDNTGAAIANRTVRFEVLTIGATVAATVGSTTFSRIASVDTNAQGVATVAIRADVEVSSEASFIRATDTVSTHRIDTWITVLKLTNAAAVLSFVPTTGGMVGGYASECPFVRREFNIYGGTAPYAVTLPAASPLVLANELGVAAVAGGGITVAKSGARFTTENADSVACVAGSTVLTVTDATGATAVGAYTTAPGSSARPTATTDLAVSPPLMSLTADPLSAYCTSSSARFTVSGGTAPYIVSTSIPQIAAALSGGTSITASVVSGPKWKMLKAQSASILVLDAAGKVVVATLSCV